MLGAGLQSGFQQITVASRRCQPSVGAMPRVAELSPLADPVPLIMQQGVHPSQADVGIDGEIAGRVEAGTWIAPLSAAIPVVVVDRVDAIAATSGLVLRYQSRSRNGLGSRPSRAPCLR